MWKYSDIPKIRTIKSLVGLPKDLERDGKEE